MIPRRWQNTWLVLVLLLFVGLVITRIVLRADIPTKQPVSITPNTQLSDVQYAKLKNEFSQYVLEDDPRVALEKLQEASISDPAILNNCHDLAHEIGQQAYKKYHDFGKAAVFQNEMCTAGYIHGLMQEYFLSNTDIFDQITTLCSSAPTGSYTRWECIHGIGHGLMYATQNNLPQSLASCRVFTQPFEYTGCINGVYMENFTADAKLHPTKYRRAEDAFYPCQQQNADQKQDCYFTAPIYFLSLHPSYRDGFSWCQTAEQAYRTVCTTGLGSQIMRRHMNNPKLAEKACTEGAAWQEAPCIQGLASYYIGHFAKIEPAIKFCHSLQKNHSSLCQNVVSQMQARL